MNEDKTKTKKTISVMLVDGFELILCGFNSMIKSNPDFQIIASAKNVGEAERYASGHKPDLAVLGTNLTPDLTASNQAYIVQTIKKVSPDTKILVMTRTESELPKVSESFEAGADGAITLGLAADDLMEVMYSIFMGSHYVSPDLAHGLLMQMRRREESSLTKREMDVLEGVSFGYTNAEIGKNLHLSVRTIETHRASIAEKTGFHSRAELVHYAMQLGLMEEGDAHWQHYQEQRLEY